jgi:hypothetical protein
MYTVQAKYIWTQRGWSTCRLQEKVLEGLQELAHPYHAPTAEQCKEAADCEVCHGAGGVPGVVCAYCRLDATVLRWETKLFCLEARAKKSGVLVSEEEAFEEYARPMSRAAREGGPEEPLGGSTRTVGTVHMTRRDNEHQIMLVALRDRLRGRVEGHTRYASLQHSPYIFLMLRSHQSQRLESVRSETATMRAKCAILASTINS